MRTFLKIAMMGLMGLFLTGCATGSQVQVADSDPVKIFKTNDGYIWFTHKTKIGSDGKTGNRYSLEIWRTITAYGSKNDYKYFGFINEGINHLEGFPINDYKQFNIYMATGRDGKKIPHLDNSYFSFKVIFYKEKPQGIFVYNINKTNQDLKDYESFLIKNNRL